MQLNSPVESRRCRLCKSGKTCNNVQKFFFTEITEISTLALQLLAFSQYPSLDSVAVAIDVDY